MFSLAVASCGGGSGTVTPMAGTVQRKSISAHSNSTVYPLNVYLPPNSEANRATLPVVYLLDGETRFQTLVDIAEAAHAQVIIVGIGNEAQRGRDYVPANVCTPSGGGNADFLDFIQFELIPFVETTIGGDPLRRILLGHSHGGSFVFYALFVRPTASRPFRAYLASDASIDCMSATVYGWDSAYAAVNTTLAARLHVSWATGGNLLNAAFAQNVQARRYAGLTLAAQVYDGGHVGIIPRAFADALAFALA